MVAILDIAFAFFKIELVFRYLALMVQIVHFYGVLFMERY